MPLTLEQLESIQAEALADDVEIDLDRMSLWTAEAAEAYFESGGAVEPAAAAASAATAPGAATAPAAAPDLVAEPALAAFLTAHGLAELAPTLAGESLAGHAASLRESGRTAFLSALRSRGVSNLQQRQAFATALAKADKAGQLGAYGTEAGADWTEAGTAAQRPRPRPPPLPPHVRLTRAQLAEAAPRTERGEWYGLPIPTSFEQLQGAGFGAAWLSRAMHAAGTLPADCAVRRLVAVHELDLAGEDAQGGIGRAGSQTLDKLLLDK